MRILDISPWMAFPPDGGSSMRICQLLSHLSRNHEVRQFTQAGLHHIQRPSYTRGAQITPSYFEYRYAHPLSAMAWEWCRRSWIYQPVLSGAVLRLVRPAVLERWLEWADVALVEFPWQFSYVASASSRLPLVLASHNVEVTTRISSAEASGIAVDRSWWLRRVERLEREAVRRADLVIVVSETDRREYIERYGVAPDRLSLIPNGSDIETFAPVSESERRAVRRRLGLPDRPTAVFIASGPKPPDRVGLAWVRRLARSFQDITFLVVGGIVRRPQVAGNVIATGFVAEPWLYLQAADMSLCPIQHGGGTKIKVFDSLAAGLPTVVFEETVRGTELCHGEHVLVAEKSDQSLESAVQRLLKDGCLSDRLRVGGREFVVAHHDWKKIAVKLESVLLALVRGHHRAGSPATPAVSTSSNSRGNM